MKIVNGFAPTGQALVSSGVDSLVFTGSVENGRRVLTEAAKSLTPAILELGGKDAMIICDDADLEQSVHAAVNGVFSNISQPTSRPTASAKRKPAGVRGATSQSRK